MKRYSASMNFIRLKELFVNRETYSFIHYQKDIIMMQVLLHIASYVAALSDTFGDAYKEVQT